MAAQSCHQQPMSRFFLVRPLIWLWDKTNWTSLRPDLRHMEWVTVLQNGKENKARALISRLLAFKKCHVPHRKYTTRPTDQSWFGYRCRVAAEAN